MQNNYNQARLNAVCKAIGEKNKRTEKPKTFEELAREAGMISTPPEKK